ncbi:MAG: zinc-dependent alcohol dehydrogenase family protein [Pseudomonadota bacterium]
MKALRLHEYIGIDGISLDDLEIPEPAAGEIRIAVEAFSLNYGDLELFENKYMFSMQLPARFGDECAGIVDAIGEDVSGFSIGDRVSSLPWMNDGYGVDGEFAIVPAEFVAHYPDNLSAYEACCIWVAYLTAYYALFEVGALESGETILITAGTSSAALAAMELARQRGANTIATSRSANNREFLLEAGYSHVIVQGEDCMADKMLEYSGDKGARIIYDPIGGKIVQEYAGGLAQNAEIFLYGGIDPGPTILPEIEMTQKAACLRPFSLYNHIYDPQSRKRGVEYVSNALAKKSVHAFVDTVYPLVEFRQAFEHQVRASGRRGKLVISTT